MCDACSDAMKNEAAWIKIAKRGGSILERAALQLPDGELREEALAMVAEIRTTPDLGARKGPSTRRYSDLSKTPAERHLIAFPL